MKFKDQDSHNKGLGCRFGRNKGALRICLSHCLLLLIFGALPIYAAQAEIKVAQMFSDHMVLQRQMAVPVWGTDAPGQKVTVHFRNQEKQATAGADGKWMVKLDPLEAGGPDKMTLSGTSQLTLNDVLVGEVWVGSGQSNMERGVTLGIDFAVRLKTPDPVLVNMAAATYPEIRLYMSSGNGHDQWLEATPANFPKFSGLLFAFGVPLQRELHVPVGLVVGAVGATPSCRWINEEAYRSDVACADAAKAFAPTYPLEELQKKYEADKAAYDQATPKPRLAPLPPGKAGETSPSNLKIGDLYELKIRPLIPYAIRGVLWDQGEAGTALIGVDQYALMGALIHSWRQDWGQGDFPFLYVQKPSGGGPAWDYADPVTDHADKFAPLTAKVPRQGDNSGPSRETSIKIMKYPNTFMVTSSDLGSGIHPTNKSGYGARAVRVALGAVYGEKIEIYGPLYESNTIEGDKVRIRFTHVGEGLAFRNGDKLQGFEIAGEDQAFVFADATIDGASVVVSSPAVAKPIAVRYAWSAAIPWANLFNKDGLPAQAFRTDIWSVTPSELPEVKKPGPSSSPPANP